VIDKVQDRNGRYILLNIEMQNNLFSLLNTYAQNDKRARDSFLIGIDTILTEQSNGIEILGGEFNELLSNADRISQSQKQNSKSFRVDKIA